VRQRRLTSWGLPLGFSHWLHPMASFHLLDSKVIFHETIPTGKESLGLLLISFDNCYISIVDLEPQDEANMAEFHANVFMESYLKKPP